MFAADFRNLLGRARLANVDGYAPAERLRFEDGMMRRFCFAGLLVAFIACGGNDEHPHGIISVARGGGGMIEASGGKSATGGVDSGGGGASSSAGASEGGSDMEGGDGGSGSDELAPSVEITSPQALSDPNDGEVVYGDKLEVHCHVQRSQAAGAADVDDASVKLALLDSEGKTIREVPGVLSEDPEEFSGVFQISQLDAGVLGVRCSAADRAASPHRSEQSISTFLDRGPLIEAIEPKASSAHPLAGAVAFEFSVKADELVRGDEGAAVNDISLTVDGKKIDALTPAPKRPGVYVASVDFSDSLLYPMPPSGTIAVTIRATNFREPKPVARELLYNFTLDGAPPTVTISDPPNQRVLNDSLVLSFTVTDPISGVDPASVHVTLNSKLDYSFNPAAPEMWQNSGDKYTFTIDKSKIPDAISQVHVSVQASDLAGNGPATDSVLVNFDELPPFVSLDPPNVRMLVNESDGTLHCTGAFDPVGPAAANDLEVIPQFKTVRAFVWDLTNRSESQQIAYYAGVDPKKTYLYVSSDTDKPLIVDSDRDGICDSVAPEAEELKGIVHLDPIAPQGTPNYAPQIPDPNDSSLMIADDWKGAPDVSGLGCKVQSTDHKNLCAARISDMELAISAVNAGQSESAAVIYAPAVEPPGSSVCTGSQIDFRNLAPDGWLCVAAAATDDVGNRGVSRPIRLCLDAENTPGSPPCALMSTTPPTCTDGCTPRSIDTDPFADGNQGEIPFPILYRR